MIRLFHGLVLFIRSVHKKARGLDVTRFIRWCARQIELAKIRSLVLYPLSYGRPFLASYIIHYELGNIHTFFLAFMAVPIETQGMVGNAKPGRVFYLMFKIFQQILSELNHFSAT